MMRVGRFHQTSELEIVPDGTEVGPEDDVVTLYDILHELDAAQESYAELKNLRIDFLQATSDLLLGPPSVRALLHILATNYKKIRKERPHARSVQIDLDLIPRSVAAIVTSFVATMCYFRSYEFIYSEHEYWIDGNKLEDMLSTEEFWHKVYNYPSRLSVVPLLPGRFDASRPRSVFVNGGLDFGRVLHLAARWEPRDIYLSYPNRFVSANDPALLSAFVDLISEANGIERMDLATLIDSLDRWWRSISKEMVQPLLVCGGWKLQSVMSGLWALENGRVPTFVCLPDFISGHVSRVRGRSWRMRMTDTSAIV